MSTEIVTAAEATRSTLNTIAQTVNEHIGLITQHEAAFQEATLEPRLLIGHQIALAQEQFTMSTNERAKLGGESKSALSRVTKQDADDSNFSLSPMTGFSSWLASEIPLLKRPHAYKLADAFRALGISTADASPRLINERVKKLRHEAGKAGNPMPTIDSLYRLGKSPKPSKAALSALPMPQDSVPGKTGAQVRLEDAREAWHVWQEEGEKNIRLGMLDDLDKPGLLKLREFNLYLRDRLNARLK